MNALGQTYWPRIRHFEVSFLGFREQVGVAVHEGQHVLGGEHIGAKRRPSVVVALRVVGILEQPPVPEVIRPAHLRRVPAGRVLAVVVVRISEAEVVVPDRPHAQTPPRSLCMKVLSR